MTITFALVPYVALHRIQRSRLLENKSFVDDLDLGRGIVSGRVTSL